MRRFFLFRTIAIGTALALGGKAAVAADSPAVPGEVLPGDWHLLCIADDEIHVPRHRMDLRFRQAGNLTGAILNRNNGSEIALAGSEFDGTTLRYRLVAPEGRSQAEMPTMVMNWTGTRFEGFWTNALGERSGPLFKLVRARP